MDMVETAAFSDTYPKPRPLDPRVACESAFLAAPAAITLESPAFADGGAIPHRHGADGARLSPPLAWRGVPAEARSLALLIEDPDAPGLQPLVHLLALDLPPVLTAITEGLFACPIHGHDDRRPALGGMFGAAYLPFDPPRGAGPRRYVFQIYALDRRLDFERPPGVKAALAAMRGAVLAKGVMTGTYERPVA